MKIGLFLDSTGSALSGDDFAETARAADARGFHSLWLAEHALFFDPVETNASSSEDSARSGGQPGLLDPFAALAFLACATERIRLGTGVALTPQRNPVQTAKLAATIDHLSGGRLDLGLGLGWIHQEFAALDVPFAARGPRTDSYLQVMRALWEDDPSECETPHYHLPLSRQWPKPIQRPLPVHIGGKSDGALRRAARYGNGWYAFGLAPNDFTERMNVLGTELAGAGRSREDFQVSVCGYGHRVDRDVMRKYRDAGADQLILGALDVGPTNREKRLDEYVESFLEPARAL